MKPTHCHQVFTNEVTETVDINLIRVSGGERLGILRYALVSSDGDVDTRAGLGREEMRQAKVNVVVPCRMPCTRELPRLSFEIIASVVVDWMR